VYQVRNSPKLNRFASGMRAVCMPPYGAQALYSLEGLAMDWGSGVFGNMVSGKSIFKRPFFLALQSVVPAGGWHATVRVQQDPETPDDQQAEKHQQHPNERKRRLPLQAQRTGHDVTRAHAGYSERYTCPKTSPVVLHVSVGTGDQPMKVGD